MVIKHFLHMRDDVGCQLLRRNVKSGATVLADTDNMNNAQWLKKRRANYGECGDRCQRETRDGQRSIGGASVHTVNIYSLTSQCRERRRRKWTLRTKIKTEKGTKMKKTNKKIGLIQKKTGK